MTRYIHADRLYVWHVCVNYENVATLVRRSRHCQNFYPRATLYIRVDHGSLFSGPDPTRPVVYTKLSTRPDPARTNYISDAVVVIVRKLHVTLQSSMHERSDAHLAGTATSNTYKHR